MDAEEDGIEVSWTPGRASSEILPCPEPYKHSSIGTNDLRLVHITPLSVQGCDFMCTIITYPRQQAPKYLAISYTWGNTNLTHSIRCDSDRYLTVTQNCFEALRAVLKHTEWTTVWIDSICIDQSNIAEKNIQVARMGKIYRNASMTLIHAGKPAGADMNGGLEDLSRYPWFRRMWVIQELLLSISPYLVLGTMVIGWYPFLHNLPGDTPLLVRLYDHVSDYSIGITLVKPIPHWRLLEMLESTRVFECSDPRDRIYALIPLFNKPIPALLRPRYDKSVEEVYTDVAEYFLQLDMPAVLSSASGIHADRSIPSWVPDWRIRELPASDPEVEPGGKSRAGFVEGSRQIAGRRQGSRLFLRGVIVDQVGPTDSEVAEPSSRSRRETWTFQGRKLFAPSWIKPDDTFCVLVGFRKIIVLRPESDHWLFVCESRLPGFMLGEALEKYTWSDVRAELLEKGSDLREFEIW